jgi:hypothetical protein
MLESVLKAYPPVALATKVAAIGTKHLSMQVIEIPHWLESAAADLVGVVAVLTAEPFSNAFLERDAEGITFFCS